MILRVANLVKDRLRGIDLVARYGGGKFVAILPQTDATGTEAVANKILGAVAGGETAESAARTLVDDALEDGGTDNVTCVVARF